MGNDSRPSSPALPGAWCSTWTPSFNCFELDEQKASEASLSRDATRNEESPHPALLESPNFRECDVIPYSGLLVHDDDASACDSVDGESTYSDDFYSVESHQDGDTTMLLPEIGSVSLENKEGNSEGHFIYSTAQPKNRPAGLNSSTHSQEDVTLADDASSKVSVGSCSKHSPARKTHLALDMDNVSSRSSLVSSQSRNSSSTTKSSSSNSVAPRIDPRRDSIHSDYSGLNYAGVCNLIDQLDAGNASEESFPRSQTPSRLNSPRQIRRRRLDHVSQPNGLELSQPDADDPWTLSLDPILTSTESTSLSSTSSVSLVPSNAPQDGEISERHFPSTISFPQSQSLPRSISTAFEANENHDMDSSTTRQRLNDSINALPLDQPFSLSSDIPHFTPGLHEEPPKRSKNVIKKTKELCSKFKRFIVSKASRQPDPKPTINEPLPSQDFSRIDYNMDQPPPMHYHRSPSSSTTSWSYRRRGVGIFQRSAKMSTPSVALSSTTEIASRNPSQAPSVNEKYSYEYHSRPKTLEEIRRSKRRFSLPTFTGPVSGPSSSSTKNLNTYSHPHRRRREGSILSAR